ncbi:MAG: ABC1 kinase family protein [Candidatus Nanohaloarchaea archaeon]
MRKPKRDIQDIERFEEILSVLVREEAGYILDRLDLEDRLPVAKRLTAKRQAQPGPERLRQTIEELGTTFIKFGQIMAERPDIVPERYAQELQKLQDSAPPFPAEKAKEIVEAEVGLEEFDSFEEEPIAAASIAQVHRAELDGEEVVVKIRRPGMKKQVEKDLDILVFLARRAEKHSDNLEKMGFVELVEEFSRWTRNELDLGRELKNAQIFRENLKDEDKLYVPEVYPEYSTSEVLVMEYVDGVKCTDRQEMEELDIDTEELANTAVRAGMKQVVKDGFFHADPHPSNFLLRGDGTMVYLDFGMMGEVPKHLRDSIDLLLIHAMKEDSRKVLDVLKEMGTLSEDPELETIKHEIDRKILEMRNSSIGDTSISRKLLELIWTCGRNGLYLPTSIALMGKNLVTMEGIGMTICPGFEPSDEYRDYGKKLLMEKNDPEEIAEDVMLDIAENRDIVTRPATFLREKMRDGTGGQKVVKKVKKRDPLPTALVASSTLLMAGGLLDPLLFYAGIGELGLGIYLHRKD